MFAQRIAKARRIDFSELRMIYEHTNYRSFLRSVLVERIQKNKSYSLRAMAKQLGVAPSTFSEVLSGRKNFSLSAAHRISQRMGLAQGEAQYFALLVQMESASDMSLRSTLQDQMNSLRRVPGLSQANSGRDLSLDVFRVIADWYHLPILQMTFLDHFKMTPQNIARVLGIQPVEAAAALERLERLELIEKVDLNQYRKTSERWVARSPNSNSALRKFHRQMLEKAIESLETQTPKEKFVGSETLAFDPAQLDRAAEVFEKCFSEVIALGQASTKKTAVYHLGIQFFDLKNRSEV